MFVTFKSDEAAEIAVKTLNKKHLKGRPMIVDYATTKELYQISKQRLEQLSKPDLNRLRLSNEVRRFLRFLCL